MSDLYPKNWDKLRQIVYKRANNACQYCGKRYNGINAHHIIALSKGGKNDFNNLICICDQCHSILHPKNSKLDKKGLIENIYLDNIINGFFPEYKNEIIYEQSIDSIKDNNYLRIESTELSSLQKDSKSINVRRRKSLSKPSQKSRSFFALLNEGWTKEELMKHFVLSEIEYEKVIESLEGIHKKGLRKLSCIVI